MEEREGEVRWDGLCSRDAATRAAALDTIGQAVLRRSETIAPVAAVPPARAADGLLVPAARDGLSEVLARLLMLSKRCPFPDVREKSEAILSGVQELGIRIPRPLGHGPSRFIPEKETIQVGNEDTMMHTLFADSFAALGRLDNVTLVMVFHPQYLESFLKTQHYLLQMDGPLPLHYRHYIGIMAAARHQCSYLVNLHVNDFLHVGGDPKWLNGLENAPQKLQNLGELNKMLAHRPWLITKEHIEQLLKTEENSWSLAELIHAVVLLTHYHSLASFTFGCGISPEIDCEGGHTFRPPSVSNYCICDITNGYHGVDEIHASPTGSIPSTESVCEVEALMEKMKQLQECRDEEEASQEEMATRFEREKRESMFVCSSEDEESAATRDVSRHFEDTSYGYKDFSRHGMHVPTFRVQDYSWEDHGYSLVNRLYPDVGQLLDEKFHIAYNLTYNTMATHKDVDTSMLRRAIWNYIHCMFGIRYDDYDYGEINQLLDRSFKVYIKTVVCTPEKTTKRMYDSFWRQFEHSEKVHVNLLLVEARMQAELLYALRAITRYMT
ncbi:sestrin-1 isoform X1 [Falco biarmicus]|uniref:sestrin-1 isoform X1 n=2 Tax=Falco TaxID=8952 RepID=UPI0018868B9A|nr:sestrin-1 isoform X1 [Falco cherrug]XP_037247138.1 sestrin-1 isoform X1 [Falco rusticolus]XP_040453500.1 sestrin-1 isoform X1 [Falco naumanni]XP_055666004.1 sestrin-1 isoform X1 [Falco peregrinus]XP_056199675.1 sestrin-1 isoform X1 [Falco biarmicus]